MSEQYTSKVGVHVTELSKKLSEDIAISKTGEVTVTEGIYLKHLPEACSAEAAHALNTYNAQFVAASAHAFGSAAIPVFKKTASLESVSTSIPMIGKDHLDLKFHRTKEYPNPAGGDKITKHGVTDASVNMFEADGSRGQLKQVRLDLTHAATEAYGEKAKA